MKFFLIILLGLFLTSCDKRVINNSSAQAFDESLNQILNSLSIDNQNELKLDCIAVFIDKTNYDINLPVAFEHIRYIDSFRSAIGGHTRAELSDMADEAIGNDQNIKMVIEIISIGYEMDKFGLLKPKS